MYIKESNKAKIEEMIKKGEGKARERNVTFDDMVKDICRIEKKLGITKKAMVGIRAVVDHNAQNFPNAYKYTPRSTHYQIVRKKGGWDLVDVYRDITRREGKDYFLVLTDEAKEAIIDKHRVFGLWG